VAVFLVPAVSHAFSVGVPSNLTGMAGYWTFDGKNMVGNIGDSSGNGLNMFVSPVQVPLFATTTAVTRGVIGQALTFDGDDTYVYMNDPGVGSLLDFGSGANITVSAWVKGDMSNSDYMGLAEKGNENTATVNWALEVLPGGAGAARKLSFTYTTGSGTFIAYDSNSAVIPANTWTHVAVSYTFGTGSSMKMYVNGQLVPGTWTGATNTGNEAPDEDNQMFTIGHDGGSFNFQLWDGQIDDFRLYRRLLSAAEIKRLYNIVSGSKEGVAAKGPSGLLGWWTFDGKDMISNVSDISGQGNTGFLKNQPATSTIAGKVGQALRFDGVNDRVLLTSDSVGVSTITLCAWVKPSALSGNYGIMSNGRFYFGMDVFTNGVRLDSDTSAGSALVSSGLLTVNTWNHLCATRASGAGGAGSIYINGALDTSGNTDTPTSGFGSLTIGDDDAGDFLFKGDMDDVRLYSRILTASEIKQLYSMGAGAKQGVAPVKAGGTGLVGYWTFDGKNMIQNVTDTSGQGNNGFLSGQAATTTGIGKIGQALVFDGVNDMVLFSNDLIATGADSISVWVYKKPGSATIGTIVSNNRIALRSASSARIQFQCDGGTSRFSADGAVVEGVWQHWVVTRDAAGLSNVYVNGVLTGTPNESCGTPATIANVTVGGDFSDYWNGKIDDLRFYDRVLTANEVKQLYGLGK
jgi:hypothetical protein